MTGKKTPSEPHLVSDALKRAPIRPEEKQTSTDFQNKSKSKVQKSNIYPGLNVENDFDCDDLQSLLSETSEKTLPTSNKSKKKSPKIETPHQNVAKEKHHIDSKYSTKDSEEKPHPQYVSPISSKRIMCFIIILLAVPIFYFYRSSEISKETVINVPELLARMQNEFHNQHEFTFGIIRRALKRVVNITSKPAAPATILLLVNKEAEHTGLKFSTSLANKIVGEKYILIKEDTYLYRNPNAVKKAIDDKINQTLISENLNVILVDKLERIPIEAAMLFHNYCDHENAPFKHVVYLFVLSMDSNLPENSNSKYVDEAAHKRLSNLWKDSSSDFFESLITRLTGNVVNIK